MRNALRVSLTIALVFGAATVGAQDAGVAADSDLLSRADASRRLGAGPAAVVVDEFLDFACPDCAAFHGASYAVLRRFVDAEGIAFAVRMYPIPRLMRGYQAAESALCAGALGGPEAFALMQESLFGEQDTWRHRQDPTPLLDRYAEATGVDMAAYRDCVERDAMAPLILEDVQAARAMSVDSTPTFVFHRAGTVAGAVRLSGSDSFARFRGALESVRNR